MEFKIEKFEKSIIKPYQEVKKYEVALFEYGDYDNWCHAIILNLTPQNNNKVLKINFAMSDGRVFDAYQFTNNGQAYLKIVGVAKELNKEESIEK